MMGCAQAREANKWHAREMKAVDRELKRAAEHFSRELRCYSSSEDENVDNSFLEKRLERTLKRIKKSDLKECIFLQKWRPLGSHWAPKNHKNRQKLLSGTRFLPLLILVRKFHDFLTPWNLANGALVYMKH